MPFHLQYLGCRTPPPDNTKNKLFENAFVAVIYKICELTPSSDVRQHTEVSNIIPSF